MPDKKKSEIAGYLLPGTSFGKQLGFGFSSGCGGLFDAAAMFSAV